MPQFNAYDPASALSGSEIILVEQGGITLRSSPNALRAFIGYTLPVANASTLGGVRSGADIVIDASGYISVNNNSHTHIWGNITSTPTTVAGYGITDAVTTAHQHNWSDINARPTTLAGYGITDAAPISHLGGDIHIDWVVTGAEQIHADRYTDTVYSHPATHPWSMIVSTPTTLAGYGITDGATGIDWEVTGPEDIHADRYTDTNTTYVSGDFDHNSLANYVSQQHIRWDLTGATQVHADRYTDTNTTYVSSDFTHNSLTGVSADEHIDWTTDQGGTLIDPANYSVSGYTLPIAASGILGGVKSGTDINVDVSGNVSVLNNSHSHLWANISDPPSFVTELTDLSDVIDTFVTLTDGQVLTYDSVNGWQNETSAVGVTDHALLSNIGTNTHAQIDTHLGLSSVHFTKASINLPDLGDVKDSFTSLTDGQVLTYDTTNGWQNETPQQGVTDHVLLSNIGTNTHAQIDTHLGLVNEHIDWTSGASGFNSVGINDDATQETLNIANSILTLKNPLAAQVLRIQTDQTDQALDIWSGSDSSGGRIILRGSTAANAKDIQFVSNNAAVGSYDFSALQWNFDGPFDIDGALTCGALTSTGIDDNATEEIFDLTDTGFTIDKALTAQATYEIGNRIATNSLRLEGGTSGAAILLSGESSATPGNLYLQSAGHKLYWDATATNWNFNATDVINIGQLGVGHDVPLVQVHIVEASYPGTYTPQSSTLLALEDSGLVSMQFLGGSNSYNSLYFGDAADNVAGSFNYDHNSDVFLLNIGGVTQLELSATLADFQDNQIKTLGTPGATGIPGKGVAIGNWEAFDFTGVGGPTFRSTITNGSTILRVMGNGTAGAQFEFFGTDWFNSAGENHWFKLVSGAAGYSLYTTSGGSVAVPPMKLYTGANTSQLVLNIDGSISMSGALGVTGAITGPNVSSGSNPGHTHTMSAITDSISMFKIVLRKSVMTEDIWTTPQVIRFDSELTKDTGYTHSNVTNPERVTVTNAGTYRITYKVGYVTLATARISPTTGIRVNGTLVTQTETKGYTRGALYGQCTTAYSTVIDLQDSDYIDLWGDYDQFDVTGAAATTSEIDECELIIERISTEAVGNTDTWRPIHDTPINGASTTSISSNWAYDYKTSNDAAVALKAPIASPTFTGVATSPQFTSTIAIGTAPFIVTSTTMVDNLYVKWADTVDVNASNTGGGEYQIMWNSGDVVYSTTGITINRDNKSITAGRLISTQTTGTAPLTVASTTKVTNLNADLLDGFHASSASVVNTVVLRNSSGYMYGNYINMASSASLTGASSGMGMFVGNNGTDTFMRSYNQTAVRLNLGIEVEKHHTIELPASGDDITWFYTNAAITVTKLAFVITGGGAGTCTMAVYHHTSRNTIIGSSNLVYSTAVSSESTGNIATSGFTDATIPAASWVRVIIGSTSAGITSAHVSLYGTYD